MWVLIFSMNFTHLPTRLQVGPAHVNNWPLSIPSVHPTSTEALLQLSSSQTPAPSSNQLDSHSQVGSCFPCGFIFSEYFCQSVSHRFGIEGKVDGGRAQALRDNPYIRQAVIRHFEQVDPDVAQHLTEHPGLFDSHVHIIQLDQESPTISDGDSQVVQTVCPQFIWLSTEF